MTGSNVNFVQLYRHTEPEHALIIKLSDGLFSDVVKNVE